MNSEVDMYQLGPRLYDQRIGVFHAADPLGQYHSPYIYSGNDPINSADPSGLWAGSQTDYWATQYFDETGKIVYDDGVDNGLEVYTTQKIIDANTSDGVTDWDAVRNDEGSAVKIVDEKKYWGWAGQVQDAIIAAHDGAARVSVDNKGNVTVTTPMGFWQMTSLTLGPVAIGRVLGMFGQFGGKISRWPGYSDGVYEINGVQYSMHALARMAPVGRRGVPPSVVEHAIKYGAQTAGQGPGEIVHAFENVVVVTRNGGTFVKTVIKIGH
jgi:hypothetical protein